MAENLGEWPFKRGPVSKIRPSDGCGRDAVTWRWDGGTISLNLGAIWEMSVEEEQQPDYHSWLYCRVVSEYWADMYMV